MKSKETDVNLYYMNQENKQRETIDEMMQRKKAKEREKRIKQAKFEKQDDIFDFETEIVIGMTNRNKIKQDEIKKKEFSKQERRRNKKIKKIKRIIKWTSLILIIGGGTAFALISPIFNINQIEVLNNSRISTDTIISLSGLNNETNIFRFFSSSIEGKIKENSYIEEVTIKRKLPNKIQIEVVERTPRFCVQVLNSLAYINSQGYILEVGENALNLPIIKGIETPEENIVAGNRLEENDLIRLEEILKIMNVAKDNNLDERIKSIEITNKNEYILNIQKEGKIVYLGDTSNLSTKMVYLQGILEDCKDKEGTIYLNGDFNQKFKPYFAEKIPT